GGSVGAAQAARARADGYTLLLGGATTHITEALLKNRPQFDPVKDLEPISGIAITAFALAVHPSVPVNNLKELVAYAKANPGKLALWLRRYGLAQSPPRRSLQVARRPPRSHPRALPRRGAGDRRYPRRADSHDRAGHDQHRARAAPRRQAQGSGGDP